MQDKIYNVVDGDVKSKDWLLPSNHPVLLGAENLPKEFIRDIMPPMGQGFIGSCVGCSGKLVAQSNINKSFSAMWIYQQAKLYDEFEGEDYSGTSISGACRALRNVGVCEDHFFPYEEYEKAQPKAGAGANALQNKIKAYYKLNSNEIDKIKRVVMRENVWCAFMLHEYLYKFYGKDIVDTNRYLESKKVGGHAVGIIGWTERDGVPYWIMQNSWGPDFGMNGKFYISMDLFNQIVVGGLYYIDFEGEALPDLQPEKKKKKSKWPVYAGIGAGVAAIIGGIVKFLLDK